MKAVSFERLIIFLCRNPFNISNILRGEYKFKWTKQAILQSEKCKQTFLLGFMLNDNGLTEYDGNIYQSDTLVYTAIVFSQSNKLDVHCLLQKQ